MKNIKSIVAASVLSGFFVAVAAFSTLSISPVYADPPVYHTCTDGTQVQVAGGATAAEIQARCDAVSSPAINTGEKPGKHQCGKGEGSEAFLGFNIGCRGEDYQRNDPDARLNPIVDMLFAFFRFLSVGVGLVVIGSIIVAGIQYSTSRGNPQATQAAIKRIVSSVGALFLYMFIYAIANFLIPGGMF